ncbi:MAG: hypothetical protein GXY64_10645 [Bacteroidales bacterium]|nr:hypothetical protein [Bacteroidales bacterium]
MEKSLRLSLIGRISLAIVCVTLLDACLDRHEQVVVTGQEDFREGDLVLRCGCGAESRLITESSNSSYSHIGILHYDSLASEWMVVHAVPGEAEGNHPEWVKLESLTAFFSYERAVRGAWMRVGCGDSIAEAAARYALTKVEQRVEFDSDYLLSDTTRLYCSELVWQAYLHQGLDVSGGKRHEVPSIISKERKCIFPCDIQESKLIQYFQPLKTKSQ